MVRLPMFAAAFVPFVQILELCRAIELAHAQWYRTLAEIHSAEPSLAALWRKTADEEEGHAAQFQLAIAGAAGVVRVKGDAESLKRVLRALEQDTQRLWERRPSALEALTTAIRMEELMAQVHLDQSAEFGQDSYRRLFRAMMASDHGHVDSLRTALAERTPT